MGAEAGQLLVDDFDIFNRIGTAAGIGDIDQMNQQAGALDVAQKLDAEPCSGVRAFDQSGDVGDYEAFLIRRLARDRRRPGWAAGW